MDFSPNNLILTANSRLTLHLQALHNEKQKGLGQTRWEALQVLPLTRWLEVTFYQHNDDGLYLLTDFQTRCVFEQVIDANSSQLSTPVSQLAPLVQEAYERLTLWAVPLETLNTYQDQVEVSHLIQWIKIFEKQLKENFWITNAQLPEFLCAKKIPLPNNTYLVGFDSLSPALQKLLQNAIFSSPKKETTNCGQIRLANTETELRTMALWAKKLLSDNSEQKIGCIIPNLSSIRPIVETIFTEILCIDYILPRKSGSLLPFNISAGQSLSTHMMIDHALTLLLWLQKPLRIDETTALLQSHYLWRNESEKNKGAKIEALLRKQNRLSITFKKILPYFPQWELVLIKHNEIKSKKLLPSEWKTIFLDLLKIAGWPAARTQTSLEYQLLERFKKLLQEFSSLDILFEKINFTKALSLLSTLCHDTIFQPKSHDESIQIMGALEASTISFDAAWIMGMDDIAWPPAAKPHPLIPFAIQQQFEMPHATAKRELQFCQRMTERLKNCAKIVVFSSSKMEGDQHRFASTLIQNIPMIETLALAETISYEHTIQATAVLEKIEDNHALPVTDKKNLKGGSKLLELQSLCPFRAFTTIRLQANSLYTPTIDIPPHTKGSLLHQALFYLWTTLKDQKTLLTLSELALSDLIDQSIEKSIIDLKLTQHDFIAIEKQRLTTLLEKWLAFEKTRPAFQVVSCESNATLTIQGLSIQTRQDRVDELENGARVLIDYKTNAPSLNAWFEERLHNLQLPLYATYHEDNYNALCFAEITAKNIQLKGIAHERYPHDDLTTIDDKKNSLHIENWQSLLESWKKSLAMLAEEFCNGIATVTPIKESVCQQCDLQSICRYKQGNLS